MNHDRKKSYSFFMSKSFIFFLLTGLFTQLYCEVNGQFAAEDMIESELGKINGPIDIYSRSDASGGSCVMNFYTVTRRLEDPDLQELPDVSYTIDIPATGDYSLWLRVMVPLAPSNKVFGQHLSIYIGIDNSDYNPCIVKVNKGWEWQRLTGIRLKQGKHTLDIKHKDFGFGIDQLFLTATGSDLSKLGMNPGREDILKANRNIITTITYPPLKEADGLGLNFPLPPAEHPRLFFRERDTKGLIGKTENPLMKTVWNKIISGSKMETNGLLDAPVDGHANFSMSIVNAIEAKALMYALYNDKTLGRNSIEAMLNFFNTVKFNPSNGDIYRIYGRFMLAGAVVYDWCYDLLSDDEKTAFIGWIETMAEGMEMGWPVIKQGAVSGHAAEFQLMRDILAAGIATYDEKKEMYMLAAGRFFKDYVSVRAFYYAAGYHHQGMSYGGYRFNAELYSTALFDRMGYPSIFGEDQKKVPYFALYTRRPDGQLMRDGDDLNSKGTNPYFSSYGLCDLLCASLFKDPVIMGEAFRQIKEVGSGEDFVFDFLLTDPLVIPEKVDGLPLSRYFPGPLGAMVARTGWESGENSPAAVAVMRLGEYQFNNHQHLDAGNFQFYYKGALASEGGMYDAYGTDHDNNYNKRSIGHNTILVFDPAEKFWRNNTANDGGQNYPNNGRYPSDLNDLLNSGFKVSGILAHEAGPDPVKPEFTYLKGDLSKAYTSKVQLFQRSFAFLNLEDNEHPAVLIVFDRVISSDKSFKKTWLLHCIEEPGIEGVNSTITRTQNDYNGRMINTTLLPAKENVIISKIGGPGHEFEYQGINHAARNVRGLPDPLKTSDESGSWRIEVSPKEPSLNDTFLNIMQVMDNSGNIHPLTAKNIVSEKLAGTEIADRVVLFSKSGEKLTDRFDLKLSGTGNLKILIADLKEGYWKVTGPDVSGKEYQVTQEGGVLYFQGKAGKYSFSRLAK